MCIRDRADTFHASVITSNAVLNSGLTVTYLAENSITLTPGFDAIGGVDFLAAIQPCSTDFDASTETPAHSRITPPSTPPAPVISPNTLKVYPNPFHTQTTIAYQLGTAATVHLAIFDATGRTVQTLVDQQPMDNGIHEVLFSTENLENGFYIARLQVGQAVLLQKMVLLGR